MKTIFKSGTLMAALMLLFSYTAYSQDDAETPAATRTKPDAWSISLQVGPTQFYGDIANDVFFPGGRKDGEIGLAFQGFVTRQFTPIYGLNFKFMYADVVAEQSLKNMYFNANSIHYGFNNTISFSNWFWPSRTKKRVDAYLLAGLGLNHYRTIARNSDTDSIISYFGYTNDGLDKDKRIIETSINLGFGAKYRLSQRLDLGIEYGVLSLPSDRFDAIVVVLSELDKYGYTTIGLTYNFGKGANSLLWDSKSELEEDPAFQNTNDKLDSLANMVNQMNTNLALLMKERELENGPDLDGDGVPDYRDLELDTEPGAMVNFLGVTIPNCCDPDKPNYKPVKSSETVTPGERVSHYASGNLISSVFFALNSTYVTPINRERIAIAALMLKEDPGLKLEIIGSTCSIASVEYNIDLSMRRANTVKDILIKQYGIEESRLIVKYVGKAQPLNVTEQNKHLNRRVDLLLAR